MKNSTLHFLIVIAFGLLVACNTLSVESLWKMIRQGAETVEIEITFEDCQLTDSEDAGCPLGDEDDVPDYFPAPFRKRTSRFEPTRKQNLEVRNDIAAQIKVSDDAKDRFFFWRAEYYQTEEVSYVGLQKIMEWVLYLLIVCVSVAALIFFGKALKDKDLPLMRYLQPIPSGRCLHSRPASPIVQDTVTEEVPTRAASPTVEDVSHLEEDASEKKAKRKKILYTRAEIYNRIRKIIAEIKADDSVSQEEKDSLSEPIMERICHFVASDWELNNDIDRLTPNMLLSMVHDLPEEPSSVGSPSHVNLSLHLDLGEQTINHTIEHSLSRHPTAENE